MVFSNQNICFFLASLSSLENSFLFIFLEIRAVGSKIAVQTSALKRWRTTVLIRQLTVIWHSQPLEHPSCHRLPGCPSRRDGRLYIGRSDVAVGRRRSWSIVISKRSHEGNASLKAFWNLIFFFLNCYVLCPLGWLPDVFLYWTRQPDHVLPIYLHPKYK